MEIKVNVSDYLSEEEIKNIISEETRNVVRNSVINMFKDEDNISRILCNTAYTNIEMEVEKIIPKYKEIIATDVKEIIDKHDLSYEVFHHDQYNNYDTLGMKYINETINRNKQMIEDRVKKSIETYDPKEFIKECFGKKINELADSFGNVADFLYNIANKD